MFLQELRDEIREKAEISGENTLDALIQRSIFKETRAYTGLYRFQELKIMDQQATLDVNGIATLQKWSIQNLDTDRFFFVQDIELEPLQRLHLRTWSRYFQRDVNCGMPYMYRVQQAPVSFTGTLKLTWNSEELVLDAGFTVEDLQEGLETLLATTRVWCTQLSKTRFQIQTLTLSPDLLLGSNTLGPVTAASLHPVMTDKKNLYLDLNDAFAQNSSIFQVEIAPVGDQLDTDVSRLIFDAWLYPSIDERIQQDIRAQFPILRLEEAVICKVASKLVKDTAKKTILATEAREAFLNCQSQNYGCPS